MRIEAQSPADVRRWWGVVRPGIQHVKEICHEPWLPEDVYARLTNNQATLFLFFIADDLKGFAVVEVCTDAGGRYLNVWILHLVRQVEANRDEILHWVDSLTRSSGCRFARFQSPRAWASLLRGAFEEKAVIYEREVR